LRPRSLLPRIALATAALLIVWTGCALPWGPIAPRSAHAQPDAYKQHMKNGVKLYQDGNFAAALVEFGAAYKAEPKASPLVNVALCHKGLFNYPKAIAALEQALSRHPETMGAEDKKAAEDAIVEMRSLLAFVNVTVKPAAATLIVDGEDQPAGTASKPVPLGPGTHRIGARLDGYAGAEQTVTVASGDKGKPVALTLVANQGFLTVRGDDAKTRVLIDQKDYGVGAWSGLLDPGTHTVQLVKPGARPYEVHVFIEAGKAQEVRRGFGGIPIGAPAPPMPVEPPAPAPKKKPEPEAPPKRGFFALAMGSLLLPTNSLVNPSNSTQKINTDYESGGAVGLRAGYRVNTPASFDLMFEYGNVSDEIESNLHNVDYSLSSARLGLNLRLMTPGEKVRLVGTIGGGMVFGDLTVVDTDRVSGHRSDVCGCTGIDGFLLGEIGIELDFGGVLLGLAFRNQFQSSKGMNFNNYEPYDNNPIVFIGGGLSIGYGTW
jgi:hypothetical protein